MNDNTKNNPTPSLRPRNADAGCCVTKAKGLMTDTNLSVWRIDDGERHYVIAETRKAALMAVLELDMVEYDDPEAYELDMVLRVEQLSADKPLTVRDDDDNESTTKTCAEWAASEGRGYLCGSVW
jgi:hypothetical protein